eukprot:m.68913 g.68913  ORF g.68913 m.68913 type:complete len:225 (+) comp13937_c0_seq3:872-1546(+)
MAACVCCVCAACQMVGRFPHTDSHNENRKMAATRVALSVLAPRSALRALVQPLTACRPGLLTMATSAAPAVEGGPAWRRPAWLRGCLSQTASGTATMSTAVSADTTNDSDAGEPLLTVSERAAQRLAKINAKYPDEPRMLRVAVSSGGCSGFCYEYELTTETDEDDVIFERDGQCVVVDETSLDMIKGSRIDFTKELIRSAFSVVDNPHAEFGCGCGVSFSPKE